MAGAAHGGDERCFAAVGAALDVLQHDDGIVDDEADGKNQRQQGQHVDREAEGRDQRQGADQRYRDGDRRHQRGAQRAQEQQHHQYHEGQRDAERDQHLAHRSGDEQRVVGTDDDCHARGQGRAEPVDLGADGGRDRHRVGLTLADHLQADGRRAVGAHDDFVILDAALDRGDVAEPDGIAGDGGDDDVGEFFRRRQAAVEADVLQALARGQLAAGQLDVVALDRRLDIGDGQVARGECAAVEPDADGVAARAAQIDRGDAVERRQPVDDEALDIVGNFFRRVPVRGHCEPHHRVGVAVVLDDDRLVGALGQAGADASDGVAHIVRGLVDVAADLELDDRRAAAAPALRVDRLHARDARDCALDDLGDVSIDDPRRGAGIGRTHRDDGGIDVGQLANRNRQQRGGTGDDDQQAGHQRQHGAADRQLGERHGVELPRSGGHVMAFACQCTVGELR